MSSEQEGREMWEWATLDIRIPLMRIIESTLEESGGYLETVSDPCMRPAELERSVLEFTAQSGGGRTAYFSQGQRLLGLIRNGQQDNITKDEDLIAVYWGGLSVLGRGRESTRLELSVPSPTEADDPTVDQPNGNVAQIHNPNWRDGKTVDEMMQYILENDEGTRKDVTFYVGPQRVRISAHKHFLAMTSIIFDYALFESPRVVAAGPQDHHFLEIRNASPHAFKMILKYVYCRRVDWTPALDRVTEAMCLMRLSRQFQMLGLVDRCVAEIKDYTTEENAPAVLQNAHDLHHTELTKFAVEFIAANGQQILLGSQYKELSPECFSMILEKDELNMTEFSILNAAVRWAEHRVHCRTGNPILKLTGDIIRAELRQVLYRIRIPLLGPKELGHVLTELAGLLNVHEEITIHRFGILKIDAGPFCSRTRIHDNPPTVQLSTIDNGRGSSTPPTPDQSASSSSQMPTAIPTAATSSAEQQIGSMSSVTAHSMDVDANVNGHNIEEELEALFQDDDNPAGNGDDEQPPRKVMRSGPESASGITSMSQQLSSPVYSEASTLVIHSPPPPFQPPPAVASTSAAALGTPAGRPLRAKKVPQRYNDAETMRSRASSLSSQASQQDYEVESSSSDLGQGHQSREELTQSDKLLNEMQLDYISRYATAECGNDLNSFYQNLCAMVEDTDMDNSQSQIDIICRNEEPIVINLFLVDNLNPLPSLYIPGLLEVDIKYLYPLDSTAKFKAYLDNLTLQSSLLFFKKTEDYGHDPLSTLWISNINVQLEINGVMALKLRHKNESLTISRITQAALPLLEGLNFECNVRELYLEEIPLDFDFLPKSLEVLTLRNVRGQMNRVKELIQGCKNLRHLSINDMSGETLDFVQDFGLFGEKGVRSIHKIAVGNAKLDCSSEILARLDHSPVQELYLDGCTFTREFLKSIPLIFPCLKKCKIWSSTNYVHMILDLLDIPTLEWLGVWELEFIDNPNKRNNSGAGLLPLLYLEAKAKVKEILTHAGLGVDPIWLNKQKKTFTLQKLINPRGQRHWVGTKFDNVIEAKDVFSKLSYEQFGWSAFYLDYELFQKLQ